MSVDISYHVLVTDDVKYCDITLISMYAGKYTKMEICIQIRSSLLLCTHLSLMFIRCRHKFNVGKLQNKHHNGKSFKLMS